MRKITIALVTLSTLIGGADLATRYEQQQRDYQDRRARYDPTGAV